MFTGFTGGQALLDPHAASQLMAGLRAEADGSNRLAGLSPRERATLKLIGEGPHLRQRPDRTGLELG